MATPLGDGEREAFFERLSRHLAEGRINVGELERRVELVAAAGSREEAAAALADLPPLPTAGARARGRRRGHGHADAPDPQWVPTPERFRDPSSTRIMRVWVDADGARYYVPED